MREWELYKRYGIARVVCYTRRPPNSGKYARKRVFVRTHFRAAPYTGPISYIEVHVRRVMKKRKL